MPPIGGGIGSVQVSIVRCHNGFLVTAGCLSLVFTTEKLVPEIVRWLHDPDVVEREYREKYLEPAHSKEAMGLGGIRGPDEYGAEAPSPRDVRSARLR